VRQSTTYQTGLEQFCPDSPDWYSQMAAFPLPACDAQALQRRPWGEYRVEVPIVEWGGRQLMRVSVQGYNTAEDVAALLAGLADLLPRWPDDSLIDLLVGPDRL
jgi:selenocysteine lyase/cysteine desulfurase